MAENGVPQIITDVEWDRLVAERAQEILDSRSSGVPRITPTMRKEAEDRAILQLQGSYTVVPLGDDADVTTLIKNEGVRLGYWGKDINTTLMGRNPKATSLRNAIRAAGGANAWIAQGKPDLSLTTDISNITEQVTAPISEVKTFIPPIHQKPTTEETTATSEQRDDTTTTTSDDPLITEIFTTFYSPDWQSRIGDFTNKIMSSLKYSKTLDPSTGERVLTADSLRRYNIYHSQLEAAQEREAADQKFRADLKRAQSTTEAGADLQRHLGDQRYRQAILTKILDDPFKYRAATGQGMYLDPQNLGDYDRMDPFRKGQYGADLGLIGETPETIGRMVTPATFAERSAPMLTSLPSWRRLD